MNEFSIVQNKALGALALFSFVKEYHSSKNKTEGPIVPLLMPVLPLVFNEDANVALCQNQKRLTSYYKVLSERRTIPVGLQQRIENMYPVTMESLNIGIGSEILIYKKDTTQIWPRSRTNPPELTAQENRSVIYTSKLLGFWFSKLTLEEICISLNIQF